MENQTPAWSTEEEAVLRTAISLRLTAGPEPHPGVEIGMVVLGGDLLVRAFRGPRSAWYRAALDQRCGRIVVGGLNREVTFTPHAGPADPIDAAYQAKYGAESAFVTTGQAQQATLCLTPID